MEGTYRNINDRPWIGPWDPNYPKGGNPVDPGVHNPWKHDPEPIKPEHVPSLPIDDPKAVPVSASDLEDYVLSTAELAARAALPQLSTVLQQALIAELAKEVASVGQVSTPELQDLTKAKARGAALRSLGIGLFIAVLTGVGSALTTVPTGTNWFSKEGLLVTGTLVVNSVVQSVLTYAHQLGWGPPQAVIKVGAGDGK